MPDGPGSNGAGPNGPDYDKDFYAWTQHQAEVLRSMPCDDNRFDRDHVAEEIEDLGKNARDAVRSHVRRILVHLLKLAHSPASDPRRGWRGSIIDARAELSDKLSPILRQDLSLALDKLYAAARKRVASDLQDYGEQEAAALLPDQCPYTLDQILADDWYPDPPPAPQQEAT
jgi:Domain of unknown function DUF29